jgi:hypothetical protein
MSRSKVLDIRVLFGFLLGVTTMLLYVQTAMWIKASASLCTENKIEQQLRANMEETRQKYNVDAAIPLSNTDVSSLASNSRAVEQQQQQLEQSTNAGKEKKEWAPAVPYRIVLLDTRYKSVEDLPDLFRKNVENTIQKY